MAATRRNTKGEKTMKTLTLGLFLLLTLFVLTTVPAVFADEDEWDDERENEQRGSGEMQRE